MKDKMKRLKARVIACIICIPIWILGQDIVPFWFTKSDAWGTIILLCLVCYYAEHYTRLDIQVKKAKG